MARDEVLYVLPYLISLLIASGVFIYAWRHAYVRGAAIYTFFVAGQALTILGFILELISPSLQTKILWDLFQWVTDTVLVIAPFMIFATEFTETKFRHPRLTWSLMLIAPIAFLVILFTDSIHHLIYPNPHLIAEYPFAQLNYDFTIVVYLYALIYVYGYTLFGIGILVKRALQPHSPLREQFFIVALGFFIPVLFSILSLFDISIGGQRDNAPLSLAAGNLIVAWGLFRYGLFEIVPIARERIIEGMRDPVIVLDTNNRVVDINRAALIKFDKKISEVMGFPSTILFEEWPVIVKQLGMTEERVINIESKSHGKLFYYELNISPLIDRRKRLLGQILVVHDVTQHRILEDGYKQLSEKLEQRVRERAAELVKSEEKFAKAFLVSPIVIIISRVKDACLIELNESFEKITGYTREEAIGHTTLELGLLANPTERERLLPIFLATGSLRNEEIQVRTKSGEVITCLYSAELIEIDGENCILASIQDITERKHAEETILNQLAFDELMTRLLTRFATCSYADVDASIRIGLQEIGEFLDSDFADLIILSEDQTMWNSAYDWGSPHFQLMKDPDRRIPAGKLTWTEHKLLNGEAIKIDSLDDYPSEAVLDRQFGEAEGIKSLLSVPIKGKEKSVFGVIDIVSYNHQINWSNRDVTHLRLIGDAIATLLERKRAEENLADAYDTTLEGWARALELRDKETEGHSRRVTETTLAVARAMGFNEEELVHIRRGSILHDIGKMGIPDDILRKAGPLTEEERQIVLKHPDTAYNLLKQISYLEKALEIPHCHHEKWDGTGYPRALKGEEIPLSARIFAVTDVWDALSSDRPYRNAWDKDRVIQYLRDESGNHFDPKIVQTFLELLERGEI